jgi:hypothetical protein
MTLLAGVTLGCLVLGLVVLVVALLLVRDRRPLGTLLVIGGSLVLLAIVLMASGLGFGPDVALNPPG